jgi:hypothetical protein
VDPAGGHFGVFADVAVASEFPHLVHLGAVADGVVDCCFAQGVDADAARPKAVRFDAGSYAVFLDQPPGRRAG